jgi:LPS export ABC transporter protein LptC
VSRRLPRLVLCAALLSLAACAERSAPALLQDEGERPDQESWGVDLAVEMGGVPRARIQAPYAARYERPDSTFARFRDAPEASDTLAAPGRVLAEVFDGDGARSATVESDRLDYYEDQRRFVAEGRVIVDARGNKRLEAERLTWDEAAAELRSDGFVRITTPTERIQGYRLVADESLDTYRLARITGQLEVEDP